MFFIIFKKFGENTDFKTYYYMTYIQGYIKFGDQSILLSKYKVMS